MNERQPVSHGLLQVDSISIQCCALILQQIESNNCRLLSCKELQSHPGFLQVLESAKAVFVDGYTFDELPADDVAAALRRAHSAGAAVIFDPGPRASDQLGVHQEALQSILDWADVVLMNEVRAVECCYQHQHHM